MRYTVQVKCTYCGHEEPFTADMVMRADDVGQRWREVWVVHMNNCIIYKDLMDIPQHSWVDTSKVELLPRQEPPNE